MDIKRLQNEVDKLSGFSSRNDGIDRLAYSKAEREAVRYLERCFSQIGMLTRYDPAGNLIARMEGKNPKLPALAIGSHVDSVYDAGRYDGVAGVVAALEIVRSLKESDIKPERPIEVIVFACEESSRFGMSTVGSKAIAGKLSVDVFRKLTDRNGVSTEEALSEVGLNVEELLDARRATEDLHSFIEIHIEQGPVLENEGCEIGIVTAIAAPLRYRITLHGQASHSGTTPMAYRNDAFLGAAEIALAVEDASVKESDYETVGTVGVIEVSPGAMNVVPGEARLDIDIRSTDLESRERVKERVLSKVKEVERRRGLRASILQLSEELPVKLDDGVIADLTESCRSKGISFKKMASGAGHDAMNMTAICPTGMLFVPSKDGLSHTPKEFTLIEHIYEAADLLMQYVLKHTVESFLPEHQSQ
ncbi:putative hydrolase [Bhargavaea cecembensis DSE10]|uniref:Putative hydrolase n=1 Tax=Bhargavaea cecembensis DSE10 TaxID=1235279 RepID=M7P7V8_9BACL|nr:Zn-dependent hydrolase [Bhargavaea cecembensis]EMR06604.1 putative hydrolase [Bhargavaea cecembensis DSE10]